MPVVTEREQEQCFLVDEGSPRAGATAFLSRPPNPWGRAEARR